MAFGLYVRMMDHEDEYFVGPEIEKAIYGLRNNRPEALPDPSLTGREKRSRWVAMGLIKPLDTLASDLPLFRIPGAATASIERYGRKIVTAIYYRETGRIASADHGTFAHWGQAMDPNFIKSADRLIQMTPLLTIGSRSNVDIGKQFGYRCNKADNPDILIAFIFFGRGLCLQAGVANPDLVPKLKFADAIGSAPPFGWVAVKENYPV